MADKVYLDYTLDELNRQYEHAQIVPDIDRYTGKSRADSARVRQTLPARLDVPYGPGESDLVDIYLADPDRVPAGGAPVIAFFHGGRWKGGSRMTNCEAAEMYTRLGAHYVAVEFGALPKITLAQLIDQCRRAMAWIYRSAALIGGQPSRIYVTGKSSGGHLAGMMLTTDWPAFDAALPDDLVAGALLVSGMYDLDPVRLTFRNEWLNLDAASAARFSPLRNIPRRGGSLVVGYGGDESEEFKRQSRDFAAAWRAACHPVTEIEMPGHHHFSLNNVVVDPTSPLIAPALAMMGLSPALAQG